MTSKSANPSTTKFVVNTDTAMKFIPIHTLSVDEKTCDIKVKGPMSPMLAAESVTKSDDFKKVLMTGLYELVVEDKDFFTTMLHADEQPRTIPIYCIELAFNTQVVIGDLGTGSLPILIYFGPEQYTFAQAYTEFPWLKVPEDELIVKAVKDIDSAPNREKVFKLTEEICNKWFETKGCGKLMIAKKVKSIDATRWWYHQQTGRKRSIMKQFL